MYHNGRRPCWWASAGLLVVALLIVALGERQGGSPYGPPDGVACLELRRVAYTVDLATASADELCLLPGVGRTLAARIVWYRATTGLRTLQDVQDVRGIGPFVGRRVAEHATLGRIRGRFGPAR